MWGCCLAASLISPSSDIGASAGGLAARSVSCIDRGSTSSGGYAISLIHEASERTDRVTYSPQS